MAAMAPIAMDLDEFRELARDRRVIPVSRRLLADGETPLGVYRKLAGGRPGTFLLESAEHGGVWSRYSFVGVRSHATLTERDGQACGSASPRSGCRPTATRSRRCARRSRPLHTERLPDLPPLTGGLVGYHRLRRRPPARAGARPGHRTTCTLPELAMMLATDLAVLDHADGSVLLIANAVNYDATDERVD